MVKEQKKKCARQRKQGPEAQLPSQLSPRFDPLSGFARLLPSKAHTSHLGLDSQAEPFCQISLLLLRTQLDGLFFWFVFVFFCFLIFVFLNAYSTWSS